MKIKDLSQFLPDDGFSGTLIGRVWTVGAIPGPSPVIIREEGVFDISVLAATTSELFNKESSIPFTDFSKFKRIGSYEEIMANSFVPTKDVHNPFFLSPFDIQSIKACGVTFMVSMLERVIEERAGGDAGKAAHVRNTILKNIGGEINRITPGSEESEELKKVLIAEGMWSQYLEVGIGPYAEIFTKAQPTSSVGIGDYIGILPESDWNNPEPEIVLAVNNKGKVVGATLGNDVNLRDIEGRSALLLGKAKDNNASCAIGPFVRLFDESYSIEDVRKSEVRVVVEGPKDHFLLEDKSDLTKISRDILDLVNQTFGKNHQYPDGFALFTGTLFAPTKDRNKQGEGFTHKKGDIVQISSSKLGMLQNEVVYCDEAPDWTIGISKLMKNLARRGLI